MTNSSSAEAGDSTNNAVQLGAARLILPAVKPDVVIPVVELFLK